MAMTPMNDEGSAWRGDSMMRPGDDPARTYTNGSELPDAGPVTMRPYRLNPIGGAEGVLFDHAPNYPHDVHGSVIVNGTQWDAVVLCVPHEADKLVRIVTARHPERAPYRDADCPPHTVRFNRVPALPGYFWMFFDEVFVADMNRAARDLLALLPVPEAP